jgi:hypothetical protein
LLKLVDVFSVTSAHEHLPIGLRKEIDLNFRVSLGITRRSQICIYPLAK